MVDGWRSCGRCHHRYGTHLSNCPRCGQDDRIVIKQVRNWKRETIIGLVVGGAFLAFGIGLSVYRPEIISSLYGDSGLVSESTSVEGITDFVVGNEGSIYGGYFSLIDKDFNKVASDATVKIELKMTNIKTRAYEIGYTSSFNVKRSEFLDVPDLGLGHRWMFDAEEITKLREKYAPYGTSYITVTLPDGRELKAQQMLMFLNT
jgi:hypothetical protein